MTHRFLSLMALAGCLLMAFASGPSEEGPHMRLEVALDRGKLLAKPSQTAVLRVSLEAPAIVRETARPPVNVALVLDVSSSMQGSKIEAAKEGALEAISRLGAGDRISVITYSSSASVLLPATSAGQTRLAERAIRNLNASGHTALFAGVSLGASELRKSMDSHRVHRLILLSDGQANRGPQTAEELGRLGLALSKEGIAVSTLGLGDDYNEDLMTRLSQSSEGNTHYVENSNDLPRIFQEELGHVLNVYAQEVAVMLDFPDNVRPKAIVGRGGTISNNKVVIPLREINGAQEKYTMVEVLVLDGKVDETREIVRATAQYVPLDKQTPQQLHTQVSASFVADRAEVLASVDKRVQRDALIMENTVSVDRALELAKEGRNEEAAKVLRDSVDKLSKTAVTNKDEQLQEVAEEMDAYANEIAEQNLNKKRRKTLKTLNYQTQTQAPQVYLPRVKEKEKPEKDAKAEGKKDKKVPLKKQPKKKKEIKEKDKDANEKQEYQNQMQLRIQDLQYKPQAQSQPRVKRVPNTQSTGEPGTKPTQVKRKKNPADAQQVQQQKRVPRVKKDPVDQQLLP